MLSSRAQRGICSLLLLLPTIAAAQQNPNVKPGWRWTYDSALTVVNAVRAGRSLKPAAWPNNTRVAVLLSFDADNETISLRYGEPNVGHLSQMQYGARVGLDRVLALLDKHQIPATFFIPAVSLRITPEMATKVKASGRHEFGIHGWIHEMNMTLPDSAERALLRKSVDEQMAITGIKPTGYRAPSWNFSPNTLNILRDMGFRYESSLMADDNPYEILQNGQPTGMVELPVEWINDDAPLLNPQGNAYVSPRDLARVWMDEFDVALAEGSMFILTMHPHVIGHRSRMVALELLVDHIRAKGGARVWWATHGAAAEYVRRQANLGEPKPRVMP